MNEALTAALVIITIVYAWSTFKIQKANENVVSLMRQQLNEALRPYVSISLIQFPGNPIFFIRIRNTGRTSALNLTLVLDRPVYQFEGSDKSLELSTTSTFKDIITSFPPESELLVPINAGPILFRPRADRSKSPLVFSIAANYEYLGSAIYESTTIDLNPFKQAHKPIDPLQKAIQAVANNLGAIENAIKEISSEKA